jgi:hypothetical protein
MREIKFRQYTKHGFHYWGFIRNGEFTGPRSRRRGNGRSKIST